MKIIGIQDSHDSGVAYIENNKIVFAINEERLSRIKLCTGFPRLSLKMLIDKCGINPKEIDKIAIGSKHLDYVDFVKSFEKEGVDEFNRKAVSFMSNFVGSFLRTDLWVHLNKAYFNVLFGSRKEKIKQILNEEFGFTCPVEFIDHHLAHAASAYYTNERDNVLIVTMDAAGDALSSTVSIGKNNKIKRLKHIGSYNSLGKLYSYVTEICGFKAVKHEGKITGLAAFGKPTYIDVFNKMVKYKDGGFVNISNTKHETSKARILKEIGKNYSREDLAASVQEHLENETIKFLKYWLDKTKLRDVVLAGGVFANVKLNQRILGLAEVDSVYIHPNMGDGGLALGAALELNGSKIGRIDNVYFGSEYSEREIEDALKKSGLKYERYLNVEKEIAKLLVKNKVIARFNGRMEYGPRALGNRSILYPAKDKTVNDWLNKNLKRCYDKETEILTNEGWKFMKDVKNDEVVATLNLERDELEFQKVLDVVNYNYEGDIYKIKNNRIDLLVTPGHYMLVKRKHSDKFKREKIEDIFKIKTYHYQKKSCGNWNGKTKEYFELPSITIRNNVKPPIKILMVNWLKFFGFWLSKGCLYCDSDKSVGGHYRIMVAQSRKSKYFNEIKECLEKLPFNFRYDNRKEFTTNSKQLYAYLLQFGKGCDKFMPRELLELNKEQLEILFDSLMKGDGNFRGSGFRYATTSQKLAENMQELSLKLGYSAYASIQKSKNYKHKDLYIVRIGRSKITTIRKNQISKTKYIGKVYCVSVPNKIIFVRRNGKSLFCGNSEFMPFAPVTLEEHKDKYYLKYEGGEHAAKFMTITFDCSDKMREESPAVVHVDNTARPQLINKNDNLSYYKILEEYYRLTKIPTIVNTSFNMHEEPIVCSPDDAIRSFREGHLDVLAIGNFIVKNEKDSVSSN